MSDSPNKARARDCVAMPGKREQTVLSPRIILDRVDGLFGTDWFDPCPPYGTRGWLDPWHGPVYLNSPWGASLCDPENEKATYEEDLDLRDQARRDFKKGLQGKRKTPKLPPFRVKVISLEHWLSRSMTFDLEMVTLVPNRSQRLWLQQWKLYQDVLIELQSIKFVGSGQVAPFPLVIAYRRGPDTDRTEAFIERFCDIGTVMYPRE